MRTFEIDIPHHIYERGMRYAKDTGITFSELCSLGVVELMRVSESELIEFADEIQDIEQDEQR